MASVFFGENGRSFSSAASVWEGAEMSKDAHLKVHRGCRHRRQAIVAGLLLVGLLSACTTEPNEDRLIDPHRAGEVGAADAALGDLRVSDVSLAVCRPETERCDRRDNDCNGAVDDGFDLQRDPKHCGECNHVCGGEHATSSCQAGRCVIHCDPGFADCDGDANNGCEADLSDPGSCGECGKSCRAEEPLCLAADEGASCVSDCPAERPTLCGGGCVDTASSLAHCGRCGQRCDPEGATGQCQSGACVVSSCDVGRGDCNQDPGDGCEASLALPRHCGSCQTECGERTPYCLSTATGEFVCGDGCQNGTLSGEETDVDCGGPLCGPCDHGRTCKQDSDCRGAARCLSGVCAACGECEPGIEETESCGGCGAGSRKRRCSAACEWGDWGECDATQPSCRPGDEQDTTCGRCGQMTRTCDENCAWGAFGDCQNEGECDPRDEQRRGCGRCGEQSRVCSSDCGWGSWSACYGEGSCSPGQRETIKCGLGGEQSRTCGADCRWGGWGFCTGEGSCTPGQNETEACGRCGQRSRRCGSNYRWGGWSSCSGQGACEAGDRDEQACGLGGTQSRNCLATCAWGSWSACQGEGECRPGQSETEGCERCGTQQRRCGSNYLWGAWGSCSGKKSCEAGHVESRSCGLGGSEQRRCGDDCRWGSWGPCTGEGVCEPGARETRACPRCGTETRSCGSDYQWNDWGGCRDQGVCEVGDVERGSCHRCQQAFRERSCTSSCRWGTWSSCDMSQVECTSSSQKTTQGCPPLMHRSCSYSQCTFDEDCRCAESAYSADPGQCARNYYVKQRRYSAAGQPISDSCQPVCNVSSFLHCVTPNVGAYGSGLECPGRDYGSGYYVAARRYHGSICGSSSATTKPLNAVSCKQVPTSKNTRFTVCGTNCPAGARKLSGGCTLSVCGGECSRCEVQ